ncbi:hypothetical protein [Fusobacterium sp. PH5-44]|uniref:hypothetical protein n=1 Tax=unclassified Fusobacterium TaxID=2648384 RepID=UPI003D23C0DE
MEKQLNNLLIINKIKKKADILLLSLGFDKIYFNDEEIYRYKEIFLKINYIDGISAFVFEVCYGINKAKNGLFEDTEVYPVNMGENKIMSEMEINIIKYYIN